MRNVAGKKIVQTVTEILISQDIDRQTHSCLRARQAAYSPDLHGENAQMCTFHIEGPGPRLKPRGGKI